MQPAPGSTELWLPPETKVVVFDLKPNEEKTVYMKIAMAVPPPNMVQYTAALAADKSDAQFYATFSKTDDQNRTRKLPDGVYGVEFGEIGNPMWAIQSGAFADTVSLQLQSGQPTRGYVVMTCNSL